MDILDPRVPPHLVPEHSRPIAIAEAQEEYQTLPSIRTPGGQVITRWQFDESERKALLCGDDLFITILSSGAINPLLPNVGLRDWRLTEPPPRILRENAITLAQRAAGNLAFLISVVHLRRALSAPEESAVQETISLLMDL